MKDSFAKDRRSIFSPYCTLFADNDEPIGLAERQGNGYFSGWKIIRRLPQVLR